MENTNNSRERAVRTATEYEEQAGVSAHVKAGAMIANALIYVGDRIGELDFSPDDHVAAELGGIGKAIGDLASEVAELHRH